MSRGCKPERSHRGHARQALDLLLVLRLDLLRRHLLVVLRDRERVLHDDGRDQVCEDKREYEHGSQEKNRVRPVKPERKIRNPDGVKV